MFDALRGPVGKPLALWVSNVKFPTRSAGIVNPTELADALKVPFHSRAMEEEAASDHPQKRPISVLRGTTPSIPSLCVPIPVIEANLRLLASLGISDTRSPFWPI